MAIDDRISEWKEILSDIKTLFEDAPVVIRADFLIDVAATLGLRGDEAALRKRSYSEAETEWIIT